MWEALKAALLESCGSKKWQAFVVSAIVVGAAKVGWNVSNEAVAPFVALVMSYLVGQGIADHGKEAAKQAALVEATKSGDKELARKIAS